MTLACRDCSGPLEIEYRGHEGPSSPIPVEGKFLQAVTLGEGDTPVVDLHSVGARLGLTKLRGKLEYLNPTASFKDRGTAVVIAVAKRHGAKEVVEDSSGNAGASVAAYSARAGIKAHIFAPLSAPEAKLRQIRAYAAQVHLIDGPREATTDAAIAYCTERDLVYASHVMSPYFVEGIKRFAYEVQDRYSEGLPKHIVMPVGNGSLLLGAFKGFMELRVSGLIAEMPKFHAVQSENVMPIVSKFQNEAEKSVASTVAGGIAVGAPARLNEMLDAIKSTGGTATAVSDVDIMKWRDWLATSEGVYAEPTSAAAFAGLARLLGKEVIGADESVLVPITGFGLKDVQ